MDVLKANRPASGIDANAALVDLHRALSSAQRALDVAILMGVLGAHPEAGDIRMAITTAWDRGAAASEADRTSRKRSRRHS